MIEVYYEEIEKIDEESLIRNVVETVLKEEGVKKEVEVYITLTHNDNIRKINAEHRNIDKPTDVLSFPMFEREEIPMLKKESSSEEGQVETMLGDIIVSVEKVREQADEYGHSFKRELAYLVTHGMLHLLGYDHINKTDEDEMFGLQKKILNDLKIVR